MGDGGAFDDVFSLFLIVVFLFFGISFTAYYVKWCADNIYSDPGDDKSKFLLSGEAWESDEYGLKLTPEEAAYVMYFNENLWDQAGHTVALYRYQTGYVAPGSNVTDSECLFIPSTTDWVNYKHKIMKQSLRQWYKPSVGTYFTLKREGLSTGGTSLGGTPEVSTLPNGVLAMPIEMARSQADNPLYGLTTTTYRDKLSGSLYEEPWYIWKMLPSDDSLV